MKCYGCKEGDKVTPRKDAGPETRINLSIGIKYTVEETKWICDGDPEYCPREDTRLEMGCCECPDAIWGILIRDIWYPGRDFDVVDVSKGMVIINPHLDLDGTLDIIDEGTNGTEKETIKKLREALGEKTSTPLEKFSEIINRIAAEKYPVGSNSYNSLIKMIVDAFRMNPRNSELLEPLNPFDKH